MKSYNVEIGKYLAKKREQRGLSQQDVADRMGCTKTAVHYWETGKRKMYADTINKFSVCARPCRYLHFSAFFCISDLGFAHFFKFGYQFGITLA